MNFFKICFLSLFCSIITFLLPVMAQPQMRNEPVVKVVDNPQFGKILTDSSGRTLYLFTPDKDNLSVCYGKCAVEWPPLLLTPGQQLQQIPGFIGKLDTTIRKDNTRQVTYNGMPLYYYYKDKKPGDTYGQDVDKQWYVINPTVQRQNR